MEAMLFAFGGWSNLVTGGNKKKSDLQVNGFLHPLAGGEGVPALLFEALSALQSESPLLAAVLEFLRYDMVGPLVAEGQRFEEQVGALFRILSIAREEMIKWKDLFLVPEKRTMLSLLGRGNFEFSADSVEDHCAVCRALYANNYRRLEKRFTYGDDFDKFKTGLSFSELSTHKGFDLLLVDKLVEVKGKKFFTAVECRFSKKGKQGKPSSSTSPTDVAKKICNALKEYPCLVTALLENRFCFVFASFQAFSGNETVESMAKLILAELKKEKFSFERKGEITEDHLLGCLIILRREHLETLLTPTLKDRYHFFKSEYSKQK
jgi:hypothetical protein